MKMFLYVSPQIPTSESLKLKKDTKSLFKFHLVFLNLVCLLNNSYLEFKISMNSKEIINNYHLLPTHTCYQLKHGPSATTQASVVLLYDLNKFHVCYLFEK